MNNIIKAFRNKKSRYGGYATLVTSVVLVILIVLNLLATKLDFKVDMTKNKLYSLSNTTYKMLDSLKQDVTIYGFYETGSENTAVKAILDKYAAHSNKIKVVYKDPVKYPEYANKFASGTSTISSGTVVVACGSKYKVINEYDMYNTSTDDYGNSQVDSIIVEQQITSGIQYVTSDENFTLYALKGHGEPDLDSSVTKQLSAQNYTIKDVNLLTKDTKLVDGSTLLVAYPTKDLSSDETTQIKDFLAKGGKAVFLMQVIKNDLPNFQSVLNAYGIGIKKTLVVEGNSSNSTQYPIYLLPDIKSHDITNALKSSNIPVLMPISQAVETLTAKKSSTTIEPLLTTSANSWGKKSLDATTAEKETGDYKGPFNIAVAVTDTASTGDIGDTKLVVVADYAFVSSQFASSVGNIDFLKNSINWLQNKKDNLNIAAKSVTSDTLTMNYMQQLVLSGVVVIVVPLVIIILGIRVWLRRRHQ